MSDNVNLTWQVNFRGKWFDMGYDDSRIVADAMRPIQKISHMAPTDNKIGISKYYIENKTKRTEFFAEIRNRIGYYGFQWSLLGICHAFDCNRIDIVELTKIIANTTTADLDVE